jgi:hypothetical protein
MAKEVCFRCNSEFVASGCGTGYGIDKNGHKICYNCCGELDKQELDRLEIGEKGVVFYLTSKTKDLGWGKSTTYEVTNWPGTMRFNVACKEGRHNIARVRRDVWFSYNKKMFHGVQYGNDSELCYIKRVKGV